MEHYHETIVRTAEVTMEETMIPDEDCYLMWQYCHDPNDIGKAIKEHDEDWVGLESLHQIISITYDTNHGCYVVFWIAYREHT